MSFFRLNRHIHTPGVSTAVETLPFGHRAKLLYGRDLSEQIRNKINKNINYFLKHKLLSRQPHLAVITFDKTSSSSDESNTQRLSKDVFLQVKLSASNYCNIVTTVHRIAPSNAALKQKICNLNEDENVDGILVHLPVPTSSEGKKKCTETLKYICKNKDVDGLRFAAMLENIFRRMDVNSSNQLLTDTALKPATELLRQTYFYPTAATAVIELLLQNEVDVSDKTVTVLGRSGLTGACISLFLHHLHANVYAIDANTNEKHKKSALKSSDVIVTATGVPLCIHGEDLKTGCVVIDLGCYNLNNTNICDDRSLLKLPANRKIKYNNNNNNNIHNNNNNIHNHNNNIHNIHNNIHNIHNDMCGDVEQNSVVKVASKVTAVPGGVGPVALSLLMMNVMKSAVINAEKLETFTKYSEILPNAPPFNAHSITGRKMHDFEHILKHTKIHIRM